MGVRVGDYLPDFGGSVVTNPLKDPETKTVWITLKQGETFCDVELTEPTRTVRTKQAPKWLKEASDRYQAARHAWLKERETETGNYPEEMREFARLHPAPDFETFRLEALGQLREHH